MQKKAVAPIIATVLLIVIVVVAVALIVAFVIPMIKESMNKAKACSEARLEIISACRTSDELNLRIGRGSEEFELVGIVIQLSNETKTISKTIEKGKAYNWITGSAIQPNLPGQFEQITYKINLTHSDIGIVPSSVAVAPIVKVLDKKYFCEVVSSTIVTEC
ncbi:MAG: archaellin/type IV pilin N-terminal domain-containing protein [Candidatus Pacearchaeota archaeon]